MIVFPLYSSRSYGYDFAGSQAHRLSLGLSLQFQTCSIRFEQALDAKPLASGSLQGAGSYAKQRAVGAAT